MNPPKDIAISINSDRESYKKLTTFVESKDTHRSINTEKEDQSKLAESYNDLLGSQSDNHRDGVSFREHDNRDCYADKEEHLKKSRRTFTEHPKEPPPID